MALSGAGARPGDGVAAVLVIAHAGSGFGAVPSTDHLRDFVLTLAARPEIADIRTSIIYQSLRATFVPVAGQ